MRDLRAAMVGIALGAGDLGAAQAADSLATVRVTVRADTAAVPGALVRSGSVGRLTDDHGRAELRLVAGERRLTVSRLGFVPETLVVTLRARQDTSFDVRLEAQTEGLETVIVSATRTERRIEDEPIRVEVLALEEIEEKLLMTPGDISMLLNETSGLRVQTTSPSLGGANVRTQGLRGRYTQIMSDGLPLYGGQAGSLGLLQIPPMDLGQVEVIKGAASALYGASALGGVINLVSRRPAAGGERELLLNQTTRGGSDAALWASGALGRGWAYTWLGGAHMQRRNDIDGDGWSDMPGYRRGLMRPRLFWDDSKGRSVFLTAGATVESREGGTLPGRVAPDGRPYVEALDTQRGDVGGVGRFLAADGKLLTVRASAMQQRHGHRFGPVREDDRHLTWFGEAAVALPMGSATWVAGAAFQREEYRATDVARVSYAFTIPSAFVQGDVSPGDHLALSASARLDAHSDYGTFINPRFSALLRLPHEWTARLSVGTAAFAPTPFTEETEAIGLTPLGEFDPDKLKPERASSASIDVGGALGRIEVNGTLFGSVIHRPLELVESQARAGALELINGIEETRTHGGELLARVGHGPLHVTTTYTYLRSTEWSARDARRRESPLTPRHAVGMVGVYEWQGRGRAGVELYYTGRQQLEDNPFRTESRPYVVLGVLVERRIGATRVFVNGENLTNVRQTRFDPLVRPARGEGGRWTTDAWTLLEGRTVNGGVRLEF